MRNNPERNARQRRTTARVNAFMFGGYGIVAAAASGLKAWQTAGDVAIVGWLAKTNAIVWDTITLYAALGALTLGVREMVLAYFMRKEYEEDLAALLENQRAQAETVQQQKELVREQAEMAKQQAEMAKQQAETIRELTDTVQQLLEQNRRLLERLDRQSNGHHPESSD